LNVQTAAAAAPVLAAAPQVQLPTEQDRFLRWNQPPVELFRAAGVPMLVSCYRILTPSGLHVTSHLVADLVADLQKGETKPVSVAFAVHGADWPAQDYIRSREAATAATSHTYMADATLIGPVPANLKKGTNHALVGVKHEGALKPYIHRRFHVVLEERVRFTTVNTAAPNRAKLYKGLQCCSCSFVSGDSPVAAVPSSSDPEVRWAYSRRHI
jgi:hypothetical protein